MTGTHTAIVTDPARAEHTMTLNFTGGYVRYTPGCNAHSEALCRAVWDCDCESWERDGVDEQGPWHEYSGEGIFDSTVRHYGKPGGECNYIPFIEDCPDEMGAGEVTFPITMQWDGNGYLWRVAE